MYKISIITINKNNNSGLVKTINSVINQTYFNKIEYIIVDGASSDGSLSTIKKYNFDNYKYISESDDGIYEAMNKGTRLASGQYLLYLNSGDYLVSDTIIEKVYDRLINKDIYHGDTRREGKRFSRPVHPDIYFFLKYKTLCHQAAFISRDLALKNPYDESLKIASDSEFFYTALFKYHCSCERLPYIISDFDIHGISHDPKNIELIHHEKNSFIESSLTWISDEYKPTIVAFLERTQRWTH